MFYHLSNRTIGNFKEAFGIRLMDVINLDILVENSVSFLYKVVFITFRLLRDWLIIRCNVLNFEKINFFRSYQ